MFCPECGSENRKPGPFCGKCGAALSEFATTRIATPPSEQVTAFIANPVTCQNCGAPSAPGTKFCKNCGGALTVSGPAQHQHAPRQSSNLIKYVLVIGALVIILATVAGAYFATRGSGGPKPAQAKKASDDEDSEEPARTAKSATTPRDTSTASAPARTSTTYVPSPPAAAKPTEYEIKNDLLGEKLAGSGSGLKFESINEFVSFHIVNEWTSDTYLMYDIDIVVRDLKTNDLYDVDVEVMYSYYQNTYVFSGITGTYEKM